MDNFELKPMQDIAGAPTQGEPCSCLKQPDKAETGPSPLWLIPGLIIWATVYSALPTIADVLTYKVFGLAQGTHFAEAVRFFIYDGPKVLMLLTLVIFGVGIMHTWVTPQLTRKLLSGRKELVGNGMAACLGVLTPFCSCSAVPLFMGFVTAGVPLGVTLSFLIAAPMVNEIALVMLYGLFGFKIAALYLVTGLTVAIIAGFVIGKLKMEHHIEDWVRLAQTEADKEVQYNWRGRIAKGVQSVRDIVSKVWLYVLIGIAIGAGIHGYVPEGFMASIMGKDAWWSVPAAVVLGIPMYTNAAGIIPIISALFSKGAALGTVLAFMMSVIALSLPEMIILRKVLKPRLIGVFITVVGTGILIVGYLFNMVV